MTKCTSCGMDNAAGTTNCRQCGKPLAPGSTADEGPPTLVPGQPAAAPAATTRLSGPMIGLMLIGLVAATAVGYFAGARSNVGQPPAPTAESVPTSAAAPTTPPATAADRPAASATTPESTPETRPEAPAQATEQAPPPPAKAAAEDNHWARMRAELANCGRANLVCRERVRWHYCKHMWGKVPDCPQSGASASRN